MEIKTPNENSKIRLLALILLCLGLVSTVFIVGLFALRIYEAETQNIVFTAFLGNTTNIRPDFPWYVVAVLLSGLLLILDRSLYKRKNFLLTIPVSLILFLPVLWVAINTVRLIIYPPIVWY